MGYPTKANVNGKLYDINTDYRVALECFRIIEDPFVGDTERALAIIYKLFGFIPKDDELRAFLEKAEKYLSMGKTADEQKKKPKDFDFNNDMQYIIPSFRSDYHIDIVNEKMHYYEFCTLISGFTDKSLMNRVRDIRNYDISKIKDQKLKAQMVEAKQSVALPVLEPQYTEEEINMIDEFEALFE